MHMTHVGQAHGFMMRSGQMPRSEKGRSACCTMVPTTPFCPCRLLNLSPTSGRRVCRSSACASGGPRLSQYHSALQ